MDLKWFYWVIMFPKKICFKQLLFFMIVQKIINGCCFSITGILQIFIISIILVYNKLENARGDACEITGDFFSGEDYSIFRRNYWDINEIFFFFFWWLHINTESS